MKCRSRNFDVKTPHFHPPKSSLDKVNRILYVNVCPPTICRWEWLNGSSRKNTCEAHVTVYDGGNHVGFDAALACRSATMQILIPGLGKSGIARIYANSFCLCLKSNTSSEKSQRCTKGVRPINTNTFRDVLHELTASRDKTSLRCIMAWSFCRERSSTSRSVLTTTVRPSYSTRCTSRIIPLPTKAVSPIIISCQVDGWERVAEGLGQCSTHMTLVQVATYNAHASRSAYSSTEL